MRKPFRKKQGSAADSRFETQNARWKPELSDGGFLANLTGVFVPHWQAWYSLFLTIFLLRSISVEPIVTLRNKLLELDRSLLQLAQARIDVLDALRTQEAAIGAGSGIGLLEQRQQSDALIADWLRSVGNDASPSRLNAPLAAELLHCLIGVTEYSLSRPTPVAYLGPKYSYSYLAAARHFTSQADLIPVSTIPAVFEAIARGDAEYGVVPIENSTDGRIVDTLTMLSNLSNGIHIGGEVLLPIHHCLLGKGNRDEIGEVYSKPQALSQCRRWLSQNLPHAKLIEISSTTAAAELAAQRPEVAAIASIEAGLHYGLNVVQANIEDNPHNLTRFAVLGHQSTSPTGSDKTTIIFQVPHCSGALARAMQVFSDAGLNLTWIESFPIPGKANEYVFFVEFEGHQAEPAVGRAVDTLGQQALRLQVLGSYPRGKLVN